MTIDRRFFLRSSIAAGAMLASSGKLPAQLVAPRQRTFKLRYAPHFGMFKQHAGDDFVAQLEFMHAEGFTAIEDNDMRKRPVADQQRISDAMQRLGIRMGVFVAHTIRWNDVDIAGSDSGRRDAFLKEIRDAVDVAKRMNATWMTVVPGHVDPRLHIEFQTANIIETLKRASAILEPHKLTMVLEPLNTLRDHPGQFLNRVPQTYMICKAVGSPSCKILFDMYHEQITEGNLIPNIDAAWDEIGYFQIGDNPGRKEPGTGEVNYRNIFRHLHGKGYAGILGMEHGNSKPGKEGERAVIDAYVAADTWDGDRVSP